MEDGLHRAKVEADSLVRRALHRLADGGWCPQLGAGGKGRAAVRFQICSGPAEAEVLLSEMGGAGVGWGQEQVPAS